MTWRKTCCVALWQIANPFSGCRQVDCHSLTIGLDPRFSPSIDSFCWYGLTSIPAWISNHMRIKMWDEIAYPFPNFNGATVEVWKCVSNFIPHFNGCNYLSMLGLKLVHVRKMGHNLINLFLHFNELYTWFKHIRHEHGLKLIVSFSVYGVSSMTVDI